MAKNAGKKGESVGFTSYEDERTLREENPEVGRAL